MSLARLLAGTRAGPSYQVSGCRSGTPAGDQIELSSWPLETRLIAPASQRVDLLHVTDRLARELAAAPDAPWASGVEGLLWRLAATVPGATGRGGLDPEAVRRAVAFELAQLADADADERSVQRQAGLPVGHRYRGRVLDQVE